jgi:hypothetical protein
VGGEAHDVSAKISTQLRSCKEYPERLDKDSLAHVEGPSAILRSYLDGSTCPCAGIHFVRGSNNED